MTLSTCSITSPVQSCSDGSTHISHSSAANEATFSLLGVDCDVRGGGNFKWEKPIAVAHHVAFSISQPTKKEPNPHVVGT
jgi:hypothetical protein